MSAAQWSNGDREHFELIGKAVDSQTDEELQDAVALMKTAFGDLGFEEPHVVLSGEVATLFMQLVELLQTPVDNAESTSVESHLTSTDQSGGKA